MAQLTNTPITMTDPLPIGAHSPAPPEGVHAVGDCAVMPLGNVRSAGSR